MKIFAIQKTQTNTYSPQHQQNNSINQNPVTKTNQTGDEFGSSNVSFSAVKPIPPEIRSKTGEQLEAFLLELAEDLSRGIKTKTKYDEAVNFVKRTQRLKAGLGNASESADTKWEP